MIEMLDATFNAKHTHTTRGACDVACFIMCDMNRENENDMWWKSEIRTITVAWDRQRKKQIRLLILMSNCNKIESRRHITAWMPRLIELYCYVCVNTRKLSSRNDVCASRTFKSSRHRRRYLIQHIYLSYIHAWFLVFSLSGLLLFNVCYRLFRICDRVYYTQTSGSNNNNKISKIYALLDIRWCTYILLWMPMAMRTH